MSSTPPPTLSELELLHQTASAQIDDCYKEHGDSRELETMRSGLLHVEEQIKQLRSQMQIGEQEIRDEVGELQITVQSGVAEIKKDVKDLNSQMVDGLREIEHDIKKLRNPTNN